MTVNDDDKLPVVTGIAITSDPGADNTYQGGDKIEATVTFNTAVTVDPAGGTPQIKFKFRAAHPNTGAPHLTYESGSGTAELVFAYTVSNVNDSGTEGIGIQANRLELNGGTIKAGTVAANLAHTALAHDTGHSVHGPTARDTTAPTLTLSAAVTDTDTVKVRYTKLDADPLRAVATLTVDLSMHFSDADEDALEYAAASSDETVAALAVDGTMLTVRAVARGKAEITVTATDPDGESDAQTFAVTVTWPEAVWYVPPASDPVRQGFVWVINHADADGDVTVTATDDAGIEYGPLTLALCARCVRHFNSDDLELGNPAKGLSGATGAGSGGWRLAIDSATLDVEALGYLRTPDGFVTSMNATVQCTATVCRGWRSSTRAAMWSG